MTNRVDQAADDALALIQTMERHARRKRAERVFGPIVTEHVYPPIPIRNFDYHATFDNLVDLDMPNWARADGATEAEALDTLLDQAEEHLRAINDEAYQNELQRRSGC